MISSHPPALRLVAVGSAVQAGAGDIIPFPKAVVLQEGLKSEIEAVAIVDGIETGLEGFCQLFVARPG